MPGETIFKDIGSIILQKNAWKKFAEKNQS
jgi:hypothetical protein